MKFLTLCACFTLIAGQVAADEKLPDDEFGRKLKALVKTGEVTRQDAILKYRAYAKEKKEGKGKLKPKPLVDPAEYGRKLKQMVKDGKITAKEAWQRWTVFQKKNGMAGKGKMMKNGASNTFYSIVVGRLKTKDIELGEFTVDVDYVTAIYGNKKHRGTIVGKTVKVVGVAGPWLDKLLLIKKGQTLKFRSGTIDGLTISLSPKATVLEKSIPFDPKTYPVPPKEFRGFRGVVVGKITFKSAQGYELTMRVETVEKTMKDNSAKKPASIKGRLLDVRGFYTNATLRKKFDDLKIGDSVRVAVTHNDQSSDVFDVNNLVERAK